MDINFKILIKRMIPRKLWDSMRKGIMNRRSKKCAGMMKRYYRNNDSGLDKEQKRILDIIRKEGRVKVFYFKPEKKQDPGAIPAGYDEEHGLYWVDLGKGKLYMRRSVKSADEARNYILGILYEQDIRSPHRYVPEGVSLSGRLLDVGAAEGWFSYRYQDEVDEIFLFEYDDDWIEALRLTFAGRKNVHIVKKYVSDKDSGIEITIDTLMKRYPGKLGCVKMDVEGAEQRCIAGAKKAIADNPDCRFFICTYHNGEDEAVFKKIFSGRDIQMSDGYMLMYEMDNFEPPFFRRGVMRVL